MAMLVARNSSDEDRLVLVPTVVGEFPSLSLTDMIDSCQYIF